MITFYIFTADHFKTWILLFLLYRSLFNQLLSNLWFLLIEIELRPMKLRLIFVIRIFLLHLINPFESNTYDHLFLMVVWTSLILAVLCDTSTQLRTWSFIESTMTFQRPAVRMVTKTSFLCLLLCLVLLMLIFVDSFCLFEVLGLSFLAGFRKAAD